MNNVLHRFGTAVTVVALAGGLATCGTGAHRSSAAVSVFDLAADPARNLPAVDPRHPVVLTVAALHASFDSLLSQHVTLVAALMHEVGAGDADITRRSTPWRQIRSRSPTRIAVVYGTDAARAFAQLWEQHSQFFVDYAQATRDHDGKAKHEAEDRLPRLPERLCELRHHRDGRRRGPGRGHEPAPRSRRRPDALHRCRCRRRLDRRGPDPAPGPGPYAGDRELDCQRDRGAAPGVGHAVVRNSEVR